MDQLMKSHRTLNSIYAIAVTDYSDYQNPIREILEYRKVACIRYAEGNEGKEELLSIIEYCNEKLKMHLSMW